MLAMWTIKFNRHALLPSRTRVSSMIGFVVDFKILG